MCSWCRRVATTEDCWLEVEDVIEQLGLFEQAGLPELTHGACPECIQTIMRDEDLGSST